MSMWELRRGLALAGVVSPATCMWLPPGLFMGISVQAYSMLPFYLSHTTIDILFFSSQLGRKKISCDCNFNETEFTLFSGCLPIYNLRKLTQMQPNQFVFFFFNHHRFSCQDQMKGNNIPLMVLHPRLESIPTFSRHFPEALMVPYPLLPMVHCSHSPSFVLPNLFLLASANPSAAEVWLLDQISWEANLMSL